MREKNFDMARWIVVFMREILEIFIEIFWDVFQLQAFEVLFCNYKLYTLADSRCCFAIIGCAHYGANISFATIGLCIFECFYVIIFNHRLCRSYSARNQCVNLQLQVVSLNAILSIIFSTIGCATTRHTNHFQDGRFVIRLLASFFLII